MLGIKNLKEMKTAKQQAIEAAYGKHFEYLEPFINENGEVCKAMCPDEYQNIFGNVFWDNLNGQWWPKSITGIRNNNGWIKIESEDDLPKESLDCMMIVAGFSDIKIGWFDTFLSKEKPAFLYKENKHIWEYKNVTHYKPITPELKPLY